VVLEAGASRHEADLVVVKDPRVKTPQRAFDLQLALPAIAVRQAGRAQRGSEPHPLLKRQLRDIDRRVPPGALRERAAALVTRLEAVEGVLVDIKRESRATSCATRPGSTTRWPIWIGVVAIADEAPDQPRATGLRRDHGPRRWPDRGAGCAQPAGDGPGTSTRRLRSAALRRGCRRRRAHPAPRSGHRRGP